MEFLKKLFGSEPLTYDELLAKAEAAKVNAVNLADGGYVAVGKYNDKTNSLNQQITSLQGQLTQRDTDMAALSESLAAAQADADKLTAAQQTLSTLQTQYADDKAAYESKLAKQQYEYAVREKANGLNFTSNAAKRAFVQEAISKDFKMDGETLLGYEDFVTKYKTDDPDAFKVQEPETPPQEPETPPQTPPQIVLPKGDPKTDTNHGFAFKFNGVRPFPTE